MLLGAVILMLHLGLLNSVSFNVGSAMTSFTPLVFETRTVTEPTPTPPMATKPAPTVRPPAASPTPPDAAADSAATPAESASTTEDAGERPAPNPEPVAQATPDPEPPQEPTPVPRELREGALSLSADVVPSSGKLIYEVQANKFPYRLNGELNWTEAEGHYEANLMFGAFGQKRTQTSRGQIGAGGLLPERFSDKFRSELAAHFNRARGIVSFSANTPDVPLLTGAQDRLSVLIQLGALLASAPDRFSEASTLTIQTVGPRDADLWLFTVGKNEALDLPGGQLQAVHLTRNPRQAYDQQVDIWLAPSLGYLPARIRITESNGDYIDQKWLRSESLGLQ